MSLLANIREAQGLQEVANGPTIEAVQTYREAVRNAPDGATPAHIPREIKEDAWVLSEQCKKDLSKIQKRKAVRRTLDTLVPELEAKAAAAKALADRAQQLPKQQIANIDLDQVKADLAEIAAKAIALGGIIPRRETQTAPSVNTLEDLAGAILFHINAVVPRLHSAANDAENGVRLVVQNSRQFLRETSGPIDGGGFAEQITGMEARVAANNRIINIDAEIARAVRECEDLARGDRPREVGYFKEPHVPTSVLYKRAREKLAELRSKANGKDQAIADNAALETAIAEARAAWEKACERRFDPTNIVWSA